MLGYASLLHKSTSFGLNRLNSPWSPGWPLRFSSTWAPQPWRKKRPRRATPNGLRAGHPLRSSRFFWWKFLQHRKFGCGVLFGPLKWRGQVIVFLCFVNFFRSSMFEKGSVRNLADVLIVYFLGWPGGIRWWYFFIVLLCLNSVI